MIPFFDLSRRAQIYEQELVSTARRVIRSGQYVLGPEGEGFERALAAKLSRAQAIGVNSGTDALHLGLRAIGVRPGDEVITSANVSVPTAAAIRLAGATPVFADVDLETYTMDPADIERRITTRTAAILPIHLYGFPADMERIRAIASAHKVPIMEDAAQAIGARVNGAPVGSFGAATALSFYPTKNLGALGDAGAVLTDDPEIGARVRRLRMYGERSRYESVEEGVNSRLDEIQAAFLSWELEQLEGWNARRSEIAAAYRKGIVNPLLTLPNQSKDGREGVWHLFVVRVADRQRFMDHCANAHVGTAVHYAIPVYRQATYAFLGVSPADLPHTETVCNEVVSLPLFPELRDDEVARVIDVVNAYA